jgi:nitrate reductase NapAB chaperone NapD
LDGYWNELVVRNIKVQSVAWFPHRVMDKDSTLQNLKSITPNIFTFNNENEMLEWFIKNGGHIETTKFKDEWSKNYDIKSLEKNKNYNIYKILTDKDYLINNINNENFINTLITFDTSDFRAIFSKLKNRNEIFNIIKIFLSMDKFIANYGFNVLNVIDLFLTQFTDNDEKFNWFVNKIFSLPNVYLSSWAVGKLIEISGDNSEKMIDKMLSSKSFLQNLTDASSVRMLYHYSDDKKKVMNIISNNSTTFDEEWWKNDRFLNRDIKYNFL